LWQPAGSNAGAGDLPAYGAGGNWGGFRIPFPPPAVVLGAAAATGVVAVAV